MTLISYVNAAGIGVYDRQPGIVAGQAPPQIPALPLRANMTETSCVIAISEQGGKENQYGNDERFCPARCGCDGSI